MSASPRIRGLLELWAAHRELSAVEWVEFQQTLIAAAWWLACAALASIVAWLALNAALVIAFRQDPFRALLVVTGINLTAAIVAIVQVHRLLRRPFFALSKREAARGVGAFLKVM